MCLGLPYSTNNLPNRWAFASVGKGTVSAAWWGTLVTSHHKWQAVASYLIIQRDHKITIIRGTVCLVFQSPMLGVQLYLEKEGRKTENVTLPLGMNYMCYTWIHSVSMHSLRAYYMPAFNMQHYWGHREINKVSPKSCDSMVFRLEITYSLLKCLIFQCFSVYFSGCL